MIWLSYFGHTLKSCEHVSFGYPFLESHQITYYLNKPSIKRGNLNGQISQQAFHDDGIMLPKMYDVIKLKGKVFGPQWGTFLHQQTIDGCSIGSEIVSSG